MTCRKKPFTYRGARDVVLTARCARELRGNTKRRECRVYACRECGCWHVTSKPNTEGRQAA